MSPKIKKIPVVKMVFMIKVFKVLLIFIHSLMQLS